MRWKEEMGELRAAASRSPGGTRVVPGPPDQAGCACVHSGLGGRSGLEAVALQVRTSGRQCWAGCLLHLPLCLEGWNLRKLQNQGFLPAISLLTCPYVHIVPRDSSLCAVIDPIHSSDKVFEEALREKKSCVTRSKDLILKTTTKKPGLRNL